MRDWDEADLDKTPLLEPEALKPGWSASPPARIEHRHQPGKDLNVMLGISKYNFHRDQALRPTREDGRVRVTRGSWSCAHVLPPGWVVEGTKSGSALSRRAMIGEQSPPMRGVCWFAMRAPAAKECRSAATHAAFVWQKTALISS
ncbi:hypothetical protein H0H81_001678 [Sphagnurus paluster]|uniref:Uncharacterized protein n=1 Tax=Sphagnurus paluster TaxID=117069 RepID=A0A9P7KIL7_9AGAR|nr:hypothetical protein H0H81_001678 [Sphagnurus paluster]